MPPGPGCCARSAITSLFGFGNLLAFDRATGDLVGEAGFNYFERGIGPDFDSAPEAMWTIAKSHQGKGLATEAMQAIVAWFDATIGITRTVAMVELAERAVAPARRAPRLPPVPRDDVRREAHDSVRKTPGLTGVAPPQALDPSAQKAT